MEKKSYYVVTETIVNFKKRTVYTFVKGISEELDGAHSILAFSKETLIRRDGFEECCTIKDEILIKFI